MADKGKKKAPSMRLDKFLAEMGRGTRAQVKDMSEKDVSRLTAR